MTIKCELCFIEYKTINALLRHNTAHHNKVGDKNLQHQITTTNRKHYCCKCNKPYASRQSKWKHEQTCSNESQLVTLTEQVKQMSNQIQSRARARMRVSTCLSVIGGLPCSLDWSP